MPTKPYLFSPLNTIPTELVSHIDSFLPFKSKSRLSQTSVRFYESFNIRYFSEIRTHNDPKKNRRQLLNFEKKIAAESFYGSFNISMSIQSMKPGKPKGS